MPHYEVFIPAKPGTDQKNVTLTLEAPTWLLALRSGMQQVGEQGDSLASILCENQPDGTIIIKDPSTRRIFRIKEVSAEVSNESIEKQKQAEEEARRAREEAERLAKEQERLRKELEEKKRKQQEALEKLRREREEAEQREREEAERRAREEEERRAREEAERKAREEEERRAREEAERKAREEAERRAREEAERKAREEEERRAREEAERKAREEEERRRKEEEKARKEAEKKSKKEKKRKAKEEKKRKEAELRARTEAAKEAAKIEAETKELERKLKEQEEKIEKAAEKVADLAEGAATDVKVSYSDEVPEDIAAHMREEEAEEFDPNEVLGYLFERTIDLMFMDYDESLEFIMDLALEVIPSEAGAIILSDVESPLRDLYFAVARGPVADKVKNMRIPRGKGFVGFSVNKGVALAISDVEKNPQWYGEIAKKSGYETKSLVCVPIIIEGRTFGAIELINKKKSNKWSTGEINILSFLADKAAEVLKRKSDEADISDIK